MARFVLAVLIVAAGAALVSLLALGYRAARAGGPSNPEASDPMQKVAFALLVALILYVSLGGSA